MKLFNAAFLVLLLLFDEIEKARLGLHYESIFTEVN